MRKPFNCNELSDVRCEICGKPLKKNLVSRKEKRGLICYKDWLSREIHRAGRSAKFWYKAKRELKRKGVDINAGS